MREIKNDDGKLVHLLDQFMYEVVSCGESELRTALRKMLGEFVKQHGLDSDQHNYATLPSKEKL